MRMNLHHYNLLAELFVYPDKQYIERVKNLREFLSKSYPAAKVHLDEFLELLPIHDLDLMQELFTRTFDVQAVTTLDVGYLLFGDDYKRGELLANLSREHREAGNDCGSELGDHLPNMLKLLARLKDEDLIGDLVNELLVPALTKMIREFDPTQIEKKNALFHKHYKTLIEIPLNRNLMYRCILRVLDAVLREDFLIIEKPAKQQSTDFLRSIDTEIQLEEETDVR